MGNAFHLVNRFFHHLVRGTLSKRIAEEWQETIRRRRLTWWDRHKEEDSFVFKLQKDIKINLNFDSVLCRYIYCDDFERHERQFIRRYLKPGDFFVDVGANIGLFALTASRCVGKHGKVFAFEPCTKTFQRLVENIKLNHMSNVQCFQMALSDRSEQIRMNVSLDGYDAWNSMATPVSGTVFREETIQAMKWDDFIDEQGLMGHVTMMKIDVEGWEGPVLSGGNVSLSRPDAPVLQVEFTDQASESAGSSCQNLYRQLESLGYQMFVFNEETNRLIPEPMRDAYPYLNLLACKRPQDIAARLNN